MSGQGKKNSGKFLSARQIIDKVLEFMELDQNKLAQNCGISPDTLRKAIKRDKLSEEIVLKISLKYPIRKEFLETGKEPIKDENHTLAIKSEQADILDNPLVQNFIEHIRVLKEMIEMLKRDNDDLRQQLGK